MGQDLKTSEEVLFEGDAGGAASNFASPSRRLDKRDGMSDGLQPDPSDDMVRITRMVFLGSSQDPFLDLREQAKLLVTSALLVVTRSY